MYKNFMKLDEDKLDLLREEYFIPKGSKEIYKEDLDFVLAYRAKLFEAMECFWEATIKNYDKNCESGKKLIVDLALMLFEHIKKATASNVMRKLILISNIEKEMEIIRRDQMNSRRYSKYSERQIKKASQDITLFLKYIASEALLDKGNFERLEKETAQLACEKLRGMLEKDFLKFVDEKNFSYGDMFFILGEALKRKEIAHLQYKTHYDKYCGKCTKDDCMLSYCSQLDDKNDNETRLEKADDFVKLMFKKLKNEPISEADLKVVDLVFHHKEKIEKVKNFIKTDLDKVAVKKPKVVVDWGEEKNICLNEKMVKQILMDSLNDDETEYDLDSVVTSILLGDFDYSKTTGYQLKNLFKEDFERTCRMVDKEKESDEEFYVNFYGLMKKYDKIKANIKNNNDELGGN